MSCSVFGVNEGEFAYVMRGSSVTDMHGKICWLESLIGSIHHKPATVSAVHLIVDR